MLSFLARAPPRTSQFRRKTIQTDDGQTSHEFFTNDPVATYGVKSNMQAVPTNVLTPPCHWHKYQTLFILVHHGTMRVTVEGQDSLLHAGDHITVQPGLYHTFQNYVDTARLIATTCFLYPEEQERDEACKSLF